MKRIRDLFHHQEKTYSFELFPPKTDKGFENLLKTIAQLCELKPDYISCTYGAGGGNREKTFDVVQHIEARHQVIGMAHLTCVLNTKDDIGAIVENIKSRGIRNILALRGDPPKDQPDWQPTEDNFKYSSELAAFIRAQYGDYFGITVAGFPEGHLLCPDRDKDAEFLKLKIDAGADFVITQLFFDNRDYFAYIERLRKIGVEVRVIPGILPITDYKALQRFCAVCGATVTDEVKRMFEPLQDDQDATVQAGTEFAIRQCQELLRGGAPGIHFYCLNKVHPTADILEAVR
ncbi:MAG: methylenetetrahydrofolate reductase, methylenetetrahydrofolate reductase (NADPH) [candidate division NC10 bacterium CSP1-5]|nr:MAG: methylenetetrahydrofolate reductase, methylenetetrahydrofolate reductase (NADPH) [candidate division NC10 bacterium CSP1-5]